jgi:hypothetical protein
MRLEHEREEADSANHISEAKVRPGGGQDIIGNLSIDFCTGSLSPASVLRVLIGQAAR